MRLLSVLFSCVCLQMAAPPGLASGSLCWDTIALKDSAGASCPSLVPVDQEQAEPFVVPVFFSSYGMGNCSVFLAGNLLGPKDFLIRTGLSPPLVTS